MHFSLFLQRNLFIHELQQNLEQITRDKISLEAEIMKMSSYKSEVMILQSEIMKLQVSKNCVDLMRQVQNKLNGKFESIAE